MISTAGKTVFLTSNNLNNSKFLSQAKKNQTALTMYDTLATATTIINNLLVQFSLGNFEYIAKTLTKSYYNTLSILIVNLRQSANVNPGYEKFRILINNALSGLLQCTTQYIVVLNAQAELASAQEDSNILHDMTLLQAYLTKLQEEKSVVPATAITATKAELKSEYALYVKLYGFPTNGIFDPQKLGQCILAVNVIYL